MKIAKKFRDRERIEKIEKAGTIMQYKRQLQGHTHEENYIFKYAF